MRKEITAARAERSRLNGFLSTFIFMKNFGLSVALSVAGICARRKALCVAVVVNFLAVMSYQEAMPPPQAVVRQVVRDRR